MENRKLNYLERFATNCPKTWYSYNILIEVLIIKNNTSSFLQILFLLKIFSRRIIQLEVENSKKKKRKKDSK